MLRKLAEAKTVVPFKQIYPDGTEEAILQMELVEHNFFVFKDSDTDNVNVIYKRKDGNYGLLEPDYI